MRTIELSIPTSFEELGVYKKIVNSKSFFAKYLNVSKNLLRSLQSIVVTSAKKVYEQMMLLFSALRSINFSKTKHTSDFGTTDLKPNRTGDSKSKGKFLVLLVVIILVAYLGGKLLTNRTPSDPRSAVQSAKATQELNKEFSFPLKDEKGNEVSDFKYEILSAEKIDQIIVKGQTATAIKGRTFLILSLKITNNYDQTIEINTKDFVRLSVNGNEDEWLAPDIHNDPVQIQAISTKLTRIGFPINDSDTNLKLRVGEISGDKEDIDLNL